jgi:hypothetical protein
MREPLPRLLAPSFLCFLPILVFLRASMRKLPLLPPEEEEDDVADVPPRNQ